MADRAVVTWEGSGEPIILTVYREALVPVAFKLTPKRALQLAGELLDQGVLAIKLGGNDESQDVS